MPRIPLIKFPVRHPKPSVAAASTEKNAFSISQLANKTQPKAPTGTTGTVPNYRFKSDVPSPPSNTNFGGKASLLPKRTPVSEEEIEAIMLGGQF